LYLEQLLLTGNGADQRRSGERIGSPAMGDFVCQGRTDAL
jgi:hypothetical protein